MHDSPLLSFLRAEMAHSEDAKFQDLQADALSVQLVYYASLIDSNVLQGSLVVPFFTIESVQAFRQYVQSVQGYMPYQDEQTTLRSLLRGAVLVLIGTEPYLVWCRRTIANAPLDASVETTIQGPQKALSEDAAFNVSLIRHRYHQASLTVEYPAYLGTTDRMQIAMVYDKQRARPELVAQVTQRLQHINKDIIQATGELQRQMNPYRHALFPTFMITERPDRVVYNLSKGKVVLFIEGNPFAMIMPAVFFDFMSSMEDLYQPYWVAKFLVILRYLGLFLSMVLPAAYVGVTSFNPEIFRVQLALSIAGSRVAVPYPSYLEVLFMLLMMELLVEASLRLPKTIGSTATTVGGLILGQAAVEAGLVSNIMIIIVAVVAISNFVIPINEMSFAMRLVKYMLLLLTTITGLVGLIVGMIGLLVYLVHLKSFQEPYLELAFGEEQEKRPK